jgi:hypothetical protein
MTIISSGTNCPMMIFIRFHVVANSDSAEDQALKLKVRDGVLAKITMSWSGRPWRRNWLCLKPQERLE